MKKYLQKVVIQKHEMNADKEAKNIEDAEEYWSEVTDIIKTTQRTIVKPIITLLSFKPDNKIEINILTESHWQILVFNSLLLLYTLNHIERQNIKIIVKIKYYLSLL